MHRAGLALFLPVLLTMSPAAARPPPPVDIPTTPRAAAAEALFDQGRKLMSEGRFTEACTAFADSEQLDHGVGTLLNLADCHEKGGRTASAWAGFRAAAAAASVEGQPERERIAREREMAIRPLLVRLSIVVPSPAADLNVTRDDLVIAASLWGRPIPVDPGEHTVVASAPGKRPFTRVVSVPKRPGSMVAVSIPALDALPPAPPLPPPPSRTLETAGLALMGVGLAGLGVGSILGVRALGLKEEAAPHCQGDNCSPTGMAIRHDAVGMGIACTTAFVASGVVLGGGVALYLVSPRRRAGPVQLSLAPAGPGLRLSGAW